MTRSRRSGALPRAYCHVWAQVNESTALPGYTAKQRGGVQSVPDPNHHGVGRGVQIGGGLGGKGTQKWLRLRPTVGYPPNLPLRAMLPCSLDEEGGGLGLQEVGKWLNNATNARDPPPCLPLLGAVHAAHALLAFVQYGTGPFRLCPTDDPLSGDRMLVTAAVSGQICQFPGAPVAARHRIPDFVRPAPLVCTSAEVRCTLGAACSANGGSSCPCFYIFVLGCCHGGRFGVADTSSS